MVHKSQLGCTCYIILPVSFQLTFITSFYSIVESYSTIYIWTTGFECRLRCQLDHHHLLSMTITRGTQLLVFFCLPCFWWRCWARILGCYPGCYHPCKMTYKIHSIKPRIFQVGIEALNRITPFSFTFLDLFIMEAA